MINPLHWRFYTSAFFVPGGNFTEEFFLKVEMEKYVLTVDVKTFCITAVDFPNGIVAAFQALEQLHPSICERPFFGISFEKKTGEIVYKAAVEEKYEGEAEKYGCETFVIKKGEYLAETIIGFMNDIRSIPDAFQRLTTATGADKSFPCVEWYKSDKELLCLVKIKTAKN
ncbi:MAG: transcriptional regulator [Bacteroidota bacterium]